MTRMTKRNGRLRSRIWLLGVFAILALSHQALAQLPSLDWAFNVGNGNADAGNGIAIDSADNVLVTGFFQGTADFDPGSGTVHLTANGGNDIFVASYSSSGSLNWAFNVGSSSGDIGIGIATDSADNVLVTGFFNGTADFDPGPGTTDLTSAGSNDIFVASYSASGNLNWAFNVGSSLADIGESITTDSAGNVLVTGFFKGTADFDPGPGTANLSSAGSDDIFVASYSASGSLNWAFNVGSSAADVGRSIATDSADNVLVTGFFHGTADFDPDALLETNLTSAGRSDMFVASYSSSGSLNWAFNVGSSQDAIGRSIATDSADNVLVTGSFAALFVVGDPADFDPGPGTANLDSDGDEHIFVASYSASGSFNWAFNIGASFTDGQQGLGIATDSTDNVFVTGRFLGTADFDPGPGTTTLVSGTSPTAPVGPPDMFLASYSASGGFNWAFNVGSAQGEIGRSIATDSLGNVLVTGHVSDTADFDPGTETAPLTSQGARDIFVVKYLPDDFDDDNDSIHDDVDTQPTIPSTQFDDGTVSGSILNASPAAFSLQDAPGPGVLLNVSFDTVEMEIDGSKGTYFYEGPGKYVIKPGSVAVEVIEGEALVVFTLNGTAIEVIVPEGSTALIEETIEADQLVAAGVTAIAGTVVVNDMPMQTGQTRTIPIPVGIDIKPGSHPNCFNNNGNGVLPVAILGSADVDATQVDPATMELEGMAVKAVGKSNKLLAHIEDVNSDGFDDLVVQIEDRDGVFSEGQTAATLTGNLFDSTPIQGSDSICIVGG